MIAGMGGKVETNAGNLNVPQGDVREPVVTIAGLKLTPVTTGEGALDTGAVFSRIAEKMAGSEFSSAWAMAAVISFREVDAAVEAAVTITGASEDGAVDEGAVKNTPADKLLLVERGWDILTEHMRLGRKAKRTTREATNKNTTNLKSTGK